MRPLLLVLRLPICLPSVTLSFWPPFENVSPVVPTQSREARHTRSGRAAGAGAQEASRSRTGLLPELEDQHLPLHREVSGRRGRQDGGEVRGRRWVEQVSDTLFSPREDCSFSGSTWLSRVGAGPSCGSKLQSPPGNTSGMAAASPERPGRIWKVPSSPNSKWNDSPLPSSGCLLGRTSWGRP